MTRPRGRPRKPDLSPDEERVRIGEIWATKAEKARIIAAAKRLTGGNVRAFLLVAAIQAADAALGAVGE